MFHLGRPRPVVLHYVDCSVEYDHIYTREHRKVQRARFQGELSLTTLSRLHLSSVALITTGLGVCVGVGALAAYGFGLHAMALFVGVFGLIFLRVTGRSVSTLDYLILLAMCGYVVLNRGFAYVGLKMGGLPLYVGEFVLAMGLLSVMFKLHERPKPKRMTIAVWLAPFVLIGAGHLIGDYQRAGLQAVRNFSLVYSAAIIPCGYYFSLDPARRERAMRLIGVALILALAYNTLYPWRAAVTAWSFKFPDGVPLFGNHASSYLIVIGAILYGFLLGPAYFGWRRVLPAAVAIWGIVDLALIQSRSGFLSALAVLVVLLILGRKRLGRALLTVLCLMAVGFGVLAATGITLRGERGDVSLKTIGYIVDSSFRDKDARRVTGREGGLEIDRKRARGMAGSRQMRTRWWRQIIDDTTATTQGTLVGKGFAHVLVKDKLGGGFIVRHSHNVYVSVFARVGLIGLMSFAIFLLGLLYLLVRAAWRRKKQQDETRDLFLFFALFFVAVIVTGMFSPLFESPHFSLPLFFLSGFAIGLVDLDKRGMLGDAEPVEPAEPAEPAESAPQ
jgi:O-antigen ligase